MEVLQYLLWLVFSGALLAGMVWAYVRFREKMDSAESLRANLPDAVKLDDLKARVAAEEKRLNDIQTQMRSQGTQLSDALEAIEAKRKAEEWLELNRPEIANIERERQQQRELRASIDHLKQELAAVTTEHRELTRDAAAIEARRSHAKEQLGAISAELTEKTRKHDETQRVVESLQERRAQLRNEVAELDVLAERQKKLDAEVHDLAQRKRSLTEEVDAADLKRAHLQETVATLSKDLEQKTHTLREVESSYAAVTDHHTNLKAQVAELTALASRHEGLGVKHEALAQQVDRLTRQKTELAREVTAGEARRQELSADLAELNTNLHDQTQALEELRTTCEALRDERSQLKADTAQYEAIARRQEELETLVGALTVQRGELVNAVTAGLSQKQQLESDLGRLRAELGEVTQTLDAKRQTTESLAEQRAILRTEVAELSELSKRQKDLKQELAALANEREELNQAVLTADQQKQQLLTELSPLRGEVDEATRTLVDLRIAIDTLRERQGILKGELAQLETLSKQQHALREQIATLTGQERELIDRITGHQTQKHELETTLPALRSELEETTQSLAETHAAVTALREQERSLKDNVSDLSKLSARAQALRTEVTDLSQQQRELSNIVASAETRKHHLEEQLAPLNSELTEKSRLLQQTRSAFDALCERQGLLKAQVAELDGLLERQQAVTSEVASLTQQQRELAGIVTQQQTLKQDLEQKVGFLSTELAQTSQRLDEARHAFDSLCERQGALKAEVAEYENLSQQQKGLRIEVEALSQEQHQLVATLAGQQAQKKTLDEELSQLALTHSTTTQQLTEARAAFDSLCERQGGLKAEVAQYQALAQQQRTLHEQIERLTEQQRELAINVSSRLDQKSQLDENMDAAKTEFAQISTRLSDARTQVDELAQRHGSLKAEVIQLESLARQQRELREEVAALTGQQRELTDTVNAQNTHRISLEEQLLNLKVEFEETSTRLGESRSAFDSLCERQGTLKAQVIELEAMATLDVKLREQVAQLTQKHADTAAAVDSLQSEKQRLEHQIAPLRQDLHEKTQVLHDTRLAVEAMRERQGALKGDIAELEALSARHKTLQTQVETLAARHSELTHHVAAATHQKDALDEHLAKVAAELDEKSTALATTKATWNDLRERQASLKTEVAELEALANRHRLLQTEVTALSGQHSELSKAVAVADSRKAKLDEELATANAELTEKTHSLKETRTAVDSLQERRAGLRAEVADLEAVAKKHATLTQQVDQLSAAKRDLDQALMTCDVQKGTAERELASLHSQIENRTKALDETKSLHQELAQQVGALRTQVSELSVLADRHAKLEAEVATLTTRHAELDAQLTTTGQRKEHRDSELAEVTALLTDRRKAMEETGKAVEALKIQRNALTSEVADLETLATRHQELEQQIATLSDQAKELAHEVGSGQLRRTQLQEKLDAITSQIKEHEETLKEGRTEIDLLREVRGGLKAEVSELTRLSETYHDLKNAVSSLTEKNAKLQIEVASLDMKKTEASDRAGSLADELAQRTKTLEEVRREYDALREQHASLKAEVSELSVLSHSRREESETLGGRLRELVQNLQQKSIILDETKKRHDVLSEEVSGLAARREQLEKTVEVVSDTLKELRLQTGYRGNNAGPLSELWKPALLKSEFTGPRNDDEQSCLKQTKKYLSNMGLRFPSRVVHAFHTSLKVSEVSPLVVLAGISGTGKSELAKRYAEGMGMHFLNLPVQPRWDSPQDMFGFFNYIENQYRATELARALVQMDPFVNEESRGWQTPEGWSHSLADRMLVVLLDEMNLARVEYYFSEFLSRLETRRGIRKGNANDRRKAEITLEVGMHGATDPTMRLFVDTNVLFVGTINEDETTQTLSEKVVDRSNVMAFGRPPRLTDMPRITANNGNGQGGHHSEKFVAFKQWQQWIKKDTDLEPAAGAQVNRWIEEMNQAMEMIRRPFAFRTHAAIRAYAANYPEQGDKGLNFAIADQIEQKILPKYRGLDPNEENVGRSLDRIVSLLDELGDGALISAVESSRRDGTREHQFIFRGVDRSTDLAEVMA